MSHQKTPVDAAPRYLDEKYVGACVDLDMVIVRLAAMVTGETEFPRALVSQLQPLVVRLRHLRQRVRLAQIAAPQEPIGLERWTPLPPER
jgi:hypothetical protein